MNANMPTKAIDGELVQRARSGDMDAFARLVRRYQDATFATAMSVLCEPGEATDVTQDAFFRAYRCLNQLREPDRFSAWMHQIVRNLARNRLARKRSAAATAPLSAAEPILDRAPSAPAAAERAEKLGILRRMMQELPGEQRLTLTLFYVDGYSEDDLSGMLDVPVGTVKSRLHRAVRG